MQSDCLCIRLATALKEVGLHHGHCRFIADRTIGRVYATVLCPFNCLWHMYDVCIVAKPVRPRAKVTIDSL